MSVIVRWILWKAEIEKCLRQWRGLGGGRGVRRYFNFISRRNAEALAADLSSKVVDGSSLGLAVLVPAAFFGVAFFATTFFATTFFGAAFVGAAFFADLADFAGFFGMGRS